MKKKLQETTRSNPLFTDRARSMLDMLSHDQRPVARMMEQKILDVLTLNTREE